MIKPLNVNKAKRADGISEKFLKMSASVTDCHLANILNDIPLNKYSKHAITATLRSVSEKDDRKNENQKLSSCKCFKCFFENTLTIFA